MFANFSCKKTDNSSPVSTDVYFSDVKTIIQHNCTITCHSPSKGFNQGLPVILDNDSDIVLRAAAIKAAVAGPFTFMNKQMPLGGQLSDADIQIIVKWVAAGGGATN